MPVSLEASFFVEEPPEVELRDGLFHVIQLVGGMRFERVMLPCTFGRAVWRSQQALSAFRSASNVVEFKAKVPDEDCPAAHG